MNINVGSAGTELLAQALGNFSPADATVYYIGNPTLSPTTVNNAFRLPIWRSGVITDAWISRIVTGTTASTENSTFAVRINDTTDHTLSSAVQFNAALPAPVTVTGLSIAVAAGDTWEIKWTTPTWTTNPTGVYFEVRLFMRVP